MERMNALQNLVNWFYFTGKNLAVAPVRIKK